MRRYLCGSLLLGMIVFASPIRAVEPTGEELLQYFHALVRPPLDESQVWSVSNMDLNWDSANAHLESGIIHLLAPATLMGNAVHTGLLFCGEGSFRYAPRDPAERSLLRIRTGAESLSVRFDSLYLRFSPDLYDFLKGNLMSPSKTHNMARDQLEYSQGYVREGERGSIVFDLLSCVLTPEAGPFGYAHISPTGKRDESFVYVFDPMLTEEVRFAIRVPGKITYDHEVINSFQREEDLQAGVDVAHERKDWFVSETCGGSLEIDGDGTLDATYELAIRAIHPGRILRINLAEILAVKSVRNAEGNAITYERPNDTAALLLFLDRAMERDEVNTFKIVCHGQALRKTWAGFFSQSADWYPTVGARPAMSYDFTFVVPRRYEVLSSGRCIERKESDGRRVSRWVQEEEREFMGFHLGEFDIVETESAVDSLPSLKVAIGNRNQVWRERTIQQGMPDEFKLRKDPKKDVPVTLDHAVTFCTWLFQSGPGTAQLTAVEHPHNWAVSYPGLIHLPLTAVWGTDAGGKTDALLAHEVAHQWWGNSVRPASYRDVWLSEGFAEYCSYLYVQWGLKNGQGFYGLLDEARRDVLLTIEGNKKLGNRESLALALGSRSSASGHAEDYVRVVYMKGALVLHMLRCLMIDPETMDESRFVHCLREFVAEFRGRAASTRDFQKVAEKHLGLELGWFFDQWVTGIKIPTYSSRCGWSKSENGLWRVDGIVRQANVPEGFLTTPLVLIEYRNGKRDCVRVRVNRNEVPFSIRELPEEPARVEFNALRSVLADPVEWVER